MGTAAFPAMSKNSSQLGKPSSRIPLNAANWDLKEGLHGKENRSAGTGHRQVL